MTPTTGVQEAVSDPRVATEQRMTRERDRGTTVLGPDEQSGVVRLVRPDGQRTDDPAFDAYRERAAGLDGAQLRRFYRDMVLSRRFDEAATTLQRQGELALFAQARGQEAAQIGSGHALRGQDFVFPSYREHGVALTRGLDLAELLHMFRAEQHGGWDPQAHGFHLYTLVIGSHALHATGYAMGAQRDGLVGTGDPDRDMAVVAYFGDGATSQGDVSEALNFAAVNDAPVVFFCQNNQWAISVPTTAQSRAPLAARGPGFGVPSVRVDGNDVLACYAVTAAALERARSGGGPTFIEAITFRVGAHTTSDDPTRYRSRDEEEYWERRDPLARLEALLRAEGEWDEVAAAELASEADALEEHTREVVHAMGKPDPSSMFDHVYATPHSITRSERRWFEDYQHSFDDAEGEHR